MLEMTKHLFEIESEQEYTHLLEHILDTCLVGVVVANDKGQYIYSNKRYKEVTGYSDQVIRRITAKEMEDRLLKDSVSATRIVLEDKKELVLKQTLKNSNRTLLVVGVPYFDTGENVKFVISNLLDLTRINQVQAELDKSEGENAVQEHDKLMQRIPMYEEEIIFKGSAMSRVIEQVSLVAKTDVTVFLKGESGTGKEMIAKRLHNESNRRDKPFIQINCSAIPETLLESELFGYEAGAFTGGSAQGKKGLLEYADKGTLLLDEIGDMPMNLQAKLLRVLQEKEFTKLGGYKPVKVDVRIIAATNADVEELVREKKFRGDLYYRLNIIPIQIPPLRDRREDIPLLAYHTVELFNEKYGFSKTINYDTVECMMGKTFKGNVRQLRNIIERLMLLTRGNELRKEDFDRLYQSENAAPVYASEMDFEKKPLDELMDGYEKFILTEYKKKYKTSYKMAEMLEKNQSTIFRKMKKYGIE